MAALRAVGRGLMPADETPNPTTVEPVEIVTGPTLQGHCGTCRWWRRNGRGHGASSEANEWGECTLAGDVYDGGLDPAALREARKARLVEACANGWEVDSYELQTRTNFGCVSWTVKP